MGEWYETSRDPIAISKLHSNEGMQIEKKAEMRNDPDMTNRRVDTKIVILCQFQVSAHET
jgi:hypothetical protein